MVYDMGFTTVCVLLKKLPFEISCILQRPPGRSGTTTCRRAPRRCLPTSSTWAKYCNIFRQSMGSTTPNYWKNMGDWESNHLNLDPCLATTNSSFSRQWWRTVLPPSLKHRKRTHRNCSNLWPWGWGAVVNVSVSDKPFRSWGQWSPVIALWRKQNLSPRVTS